MPELPEVQTTVNGLNKTVAGLTISDVWTDLARDYVARPDYHDTIKYLPFYKSFRKKVCGIKIIKSERRAKNILINLENGNTILVHMKMTGHLLYGEYEYNKKKDSWSVSPNEKNNALRDPFNRFVHFVFSFTNGKHLVFSDTRKFGKITILSTSLAHQTKHLAGLGPDPLGKDFDGAVFAKLILQKPRGKIKTVLMDQTIISGIGNIYSDEALWLAGISPISIAEKLPKKDLKNLFSAVQKVLRKGIDFGGDSMSDYRQIDGNPGKFQNEHNVYKRKGENCKKSNCKGVIIRQLVGGRSTHFCPVHQKIYN